MKRIAISLLLLCGLAAICHAQFISIIGSKGVSSTQLTAPTFSPVAGNYSIPQTVTLSGPAGAIICYSTTGPITVTTPGACPVGSTAYAAGIAVTASTTIYAVSTQVGLTTSAGSSAPYVILATLGSGSVTQANFRISTVAGAALVDFNVAGALTPYIGAKITITDSTSHTIVGYIKAAGTGQTYGAQLLPNTTLTGTTSLTANTATLASVACASPSGSCLQVTTTGNFGQGCQGGTTVSGGLYQSTAYTVKGTESSLYYFKTGPGCTSTPYLQVSSGAPASLTQLTAYVTATGTTTTQAYANYTSGKTELWATPSLLQVLTPSATGVTVVSAQGGSAQAWASVNSSFTFNSSGNYTYTITTY